MERYINEWILNVKDREEYKKKLGREIVSNLQVKDRLSTPVNYGY
jgi:hypothetical protein